MANPYFQLQGPDGQSKSDNVKISRSELRFGPLSITRVNTVPDMETGRPGDVVLIDSTDNPRFRNLVDLPAPESVGMWMKQPQSYTTSLQGNVVIGFPAGYASAGDVLSINGTSVTLHSPYDVLTIANDINTAGISNISSKVLGEAVVVQNSAGGKIEITNLSGRPTDTIGLYTQESTSVTNPNGVWMPLQDVAQSGTPSAPTAASYLTMFPEGALPNERVLKAGTGLKITDGGAGNDVTVDIDIPSVPVTSEPSDPADKILIYNVSLGKLESADFGSLPIPLTSATVQQANNTIGVSGTSNVGPLLPPNSVVKRILVAVDTAYPIGATMSIGTSSSPSIIASTASIDLQTTGVYEIIPATLFTASTQIIATIGGAPGFGSARVLMDYAVP